jgi:hypothetical protein
MDEEDIAAQELVKAVKNCSKSTREEVFEKYEELL